MIRSILKGAKALAIFFTLPNAWTSEYLESVKKEVDDLLLLQAAYYSYDRIGEALDETLKSLAQKVIEFSCLESYKKVPSQCEVAF